MNASVCQHQVSHFAMACLYAVKLQTTCPHLFSGMHLCLDFLFARFKFAMFFTIRHILFVTCPAARSRWDRPSLQALACYVFLVFCCLLFVCAQKNPLCCLECAFPVSPVYYEEVLTQVALT